MNATDDAIASSKRAIQALLKERVETLVILELVQPDDLSVLDDAYRYPDIHIARYALRKLDTLDARRKQMRGH